MNSWLDLLLPPICAHCGCAVDAGAALCPPCDLRLPRWEEMAPQLAGLEACVAGLCYAGEAVDWIHRFKYPKPGLSGLDPAAACVLRGVMREAAERAPGPAPQLVVPVPLHPRRLRMRGFNPAGVLARAVAREVGTRFEATALVRVRDTPSQTGLTRSVRRRNLRGAIRAASRRRLPERVWLVDDVVTTGSTLEAAAEALRRGGVKSVVAVCAAFTPLAD
jgi:ComF family protein